MVVHYACSGVGANSAMQDRACIHDYFYTCMLGAFVDQEYSINIVARQHHFKRQFVSVNFVTDRTSRFDAFSLIAQVISGTIRTWQPGRLAAGR